MTEHLDSNVFSLDRQRHIARGMVAMCPHCHTPTYIRNSRLITDVYREAWAGCVKCGFKGKCHLAWDLEILPSLMPNPTVRLLRLPYDEAVEQFTAAELATRDQLDLFVASG